MEFASICRTCLSGDSLKPIFATNNDNEKYSNDISMATGVQIQYNDNLPQNMCGNCLNKLEEVLEFRKQCKDVETELLSIIAVQHPDTDDEYCLKNIQYTTKILSKSYCIKTESDKEKIKNLTEIDHNKPLKSLLNSQLAKIKIIPLEKSHKLETDENPHNDYEQKTETSDLENSENDTQDKPKHNTKLRIKRTKKSKKHLSENISVSNTETIESESFSDTKIISNTEGTVTEAPYEVITDPETQKASKVFCKLCNKVLSIRSIDSHMTKRHPGADSRKVKCDLCDSYVMKEKLNRHMGMMHGSGNLKCGYCKTEFNAKEELIQHVTSCTAKKRTRKTNESGRELCECDICHKVMQKASIRMHKAVKHAGLKPVCEHCGKSFGNKFRLNEHYRAKHGYEKFQCNYCDFRSAAIMAMRNHERRHRGEKPFVCETCGAKFHAAYLLAQHKHSHRTEKLVKCDLCPASFKANNSLHMHKLSCHSKSAYRCGVCCRSYKCRHYAVKHARHVHRYAATDVVQLAA